MKQTFGGICALLTGSVVFATVSAQLHAAEVEHSARGSAERMIERCLRHAAAQGLPALSVGVIDASGALVAFVRQDGASPATVEAALLKARTAMRLNAPTVLLGPALSADAATRDAFLIMQLTTLPGGVPFADAAGRAAGAVGVSGGTAEQDADCAQRAVSDGGQVK